MLKTAINMESKISFVIAVLACSVVVAQTASLKNNSDFHSYAVRLTLSRHSAQVKNFKHCAAVRLGDDWLMTAAECFDDAEHKFVRIASPDHYDSRNKQFEVERDELTQRDHLKIMIHPEYDQKTKANNLVLMKTNLTCTWDKDTDIHLPSLKHEQNSYVNENGSVYTYDMDRFSDDMHVTTLNATMTWPFFCSPKMDVQSYICAAVSGIKGMSMDDLGAPLVYQETKNSPKTLIGILSSIRELDGEQSVPLQFTRVYKYLNWIYGVTKIPLGQQ